MVYEVDLDSTLPKKNKNLPILLKLSISYFIKNRKVLLLAMSDHIFCNKAFKHFLKKNGVTHKIALPLSSSNQ